jgi:3-phenylpropionate/cinnamic acid dioxygenase small subunit
LKKEEGSIIMVPDHVAISNLIFTYAERLDSGDLDGVGELFAHGEFEGMFGGPYRGTEEATRNFRETTRLFDDGLPWQRHVTTNLQISIADDGNSASCRSYYTAFQEVPETNNLQPIGVGRYLDEFRKIDGKWYFTRRQLIRDLTGDLSHAKPTP